MGAKEDRRVDDVPLWEQSASISEAREHDHLKSGDVIQEWRAKNTGDGSIKWRWLDGDVLAVVDKPCGGEGAPAWVALVQWRDGNEVKSWSALTQHEWVDKGAVLRRNKPKDQNRAGPAMEGGDQ